MLDAFNNDGFSVARDNLLSFPIVAQSPLVERLFHVLIGRFGIGLASFSKIFVLELPMFDGEFVDFKRLRQICACCAKRRHGFGD